MLVPASLTASGLLVLLLAEWRGLPWLRAVSKAAAASGFVWGGWNATAVVPGALSTSVFVGLCFSVVGDLFLLSGRSRWFLAGLGAFVLAHIAYACGFISAGLALGPLLAGACLAVLISGLVWRWLCGHLEPQMSGPVLAYIVVIGLMLATAVGAWGKGAPAWLAAGAVCFLASDLFVARARFVRAGLVNKLVGLPLYFGAQWLFILGLVSN